MEHFQCFECGMISSDQGPISSHMRKSHNIKVEVDNLSRKFPCSLCRFTTRSMEEIKKHLISEHNKEQHNWMVEEVTEEFVCDDCDMKFSRKSELETHMNIVHSGDRGNKVNTSELRQVNEEISDDEAEIKQEKEDLDFSFDEKLLMFN